MNKKKARSSLVDDDDDVSFDLEGDAEDLLQEALQPDGKPKKLSLLLPKEPEDFMGAEEDDDEKQELQKQKERERLERQQQEKAAQKAKNDKELLKQQTNAFGVLSNLSATELEDHYLKCIQLCNQNKVNVKNAFKLQLIDYMKLIFAKHSEKTKNLALMGYTLDASAKIYSYRVDKVYADMMKVMSGKAFKDVEEDDDAESKGGEDGAGDNEENGEETPRKKRKKNYLEDDKDLNFEKVLCSEQELQKTQTDGDGLLKERTTLPSHLEFFLECPARDPKGLLCLNGPLFDPEEEEEVSSCVAIAFMPEGESISLHASSWLPTYKDMHKSYCLMGEMNETLVQNKALIYDSTAEDVVEHCRNYNHGDEDDMNTDGLEPEQVIDYDDGFSDDEPGAPSVSSLGVNSINSNKSKTSFSIKGMSSMVSISDNEFSYFDSSKLNFWAGPSHWSIKPVKKRTAITPGDNVPQKGAKKSFTIDFGTIEVDKMKKIFDEQTMGLSRKTIRAWSKEKARFMNIAYTPRKLLSLFHNSSLLYVNKSFTSHGIFEAAKSRLLDEAGDHITPENYVCRDDDDPEVNMLDDHHDDDDPNDGPPGSPLPQEPDPADLSNGLKLLPAPHKVEKIAIHFSKAQRKVDMKRLKTAIWDFMDLESNVKENISSRINTPPPTGRLKRDSTGPVMFSDVLAALPKLLPPEESSQLSTGVVFMAILHMANEKTLRLDQDPSYKDFTISMEY